MGNDDDTEILESGSFTRPYLLTGGRTRSDAGELAVEAMVAVAGTLEVLETTRSDDIAIVRRLLDGIRNR